MSINEQGKQQQTISIDIITDAFHSQFHDVSVKWSDYCYDKSNKYTILSIGIDIAQLISVRSFLDKIGIPDDKIVFSIDDINRLQTNLYDTARANQ